MRKSERNLLIINSILIIIFFLSIFVKNIFNNYIMSLFLGIIILIIIKLMGYEKDKNIYKKNLVFYIVLYSFIFLSLYYVLGLLIGYQYTGYSHSITNLIKNILSATMIILTSEFLRYLISKKGEKNKKIFITTIIVFILIDIVLNLRFYDIRKLNKTLELLTYIILPSIFKNFMLTSFSYRYGLIQNIIYRLIMELYIFIIPIVPSTGIYVDSVLFMIYPVLLKKNIYYKFEKDEKVDYKDKKILKKILSIILMIITIITIMLVSNIFRFWLAVVASGSMEPAIKVGDAIIVDKGYQKHLNKLKVGDVLVFKNNNDKIYTHRIIKIKKEKNNYKINTKGDKKGNAVDNWIVTNKNVIGVVKFKIRYIGYPTVWLSRILEGS